LYPARLPTDFFRASGNIMKTLKVNTSERLALGSILPDKGSFLNLKLLRELREKLSFSDEEHARLKFVSLPNGQVRWNQPENPEDDYVTIEIGDVMAEMLKNRLLEMDKKEELTPNLISPYEQIVLADH
jgi:hypothetical protein